MQKVDCTVSYQDEASYEKSSIERQSDKKG